MTLGTRASMAPAAAFAFMLLRAERARKLFGLTPASARPPPPPASLLAAARALALARLGRRP